MKMTKKTMAGRKTAIVFVMSPFSSDLKKTSALGELSLAASSLLAKLFALDHTGVPAEHPRFFQNGTRIGIEL